MRQTLHTTLPGWLRARRGVIGLLAAVFACFFAVYALYGHTWQVFGYAALLAAVACAITGGWDFIRFTGKVHALAKLPGKFPLGALPPTDTLLEQEYQAIAEALEQERIALEAHHEVARRDAEEYYTLWVHQIKTPLAAMALLLDGEEEAAPRESLATLRQELFRVGQYVNMALQYQRLHSLQSDLVLEQHSLAALVKQAAKACAPLFIYSGVSFTMDELPGCIVTDGKWFCFVLEQLLTNAVKYAPGGKVRIYLQNDDTLVVEDTGMGIPPEDLPRVFERGFTGAAGRTERSSTGIGLYLCREILARLGFGISIASTPGKGTRALLDLQQQALPLE